MDLFDTDEEDKIIEHWDVIAPVTEDSVSSHTQIDGPTEVTDLDATYRNKKIVAEFHEEVLVGGNLDRAPAFISTERYVQHNPQIADGLEGFTAYASGLAKQGKAMQYESAFKIIGQGNFVVSYSKMLLGESPYAIFDLYRIENGKIVEHWDNMELILPGDQWGNSGKF